MGLPVLGPLPLRGRIPHSRGGVRVRVRGRPTPASSGDRDGLYRQGQLGPAPLHLQPDRSKALSSDRRPEAVLHRALERLGQRGLAASSRQSTRRMQPPVKQGGTAEAEPFVPEGAGGFFVGWSVGQSISWSVGQLFCRTMMFWEAGNVVPTRSTRMAGSRRSFRPRSGRGFICCSGCVGR